MTDKTIRIDKLIRSKRKTFELAVLPDGSLQVRAPMRASRAEIEALVSQKAGWILRKQELAVARKEQTAHLEFIDGAQFLYLGRSYPLKIVEEAAAPLVFSDRFYISRAALPAAAKVFEAWYRREALGLLQERTAYLSNQNGIPTPKVRINGARRQWGSCGSKGALNFTWRLVMAPLEVIDYVVVHELAHLQERNHSSRFWKRVEELMPDYRARRAWLKENGRLVLSFR